MLEPDSTHSGLEFALIAGIVLLFTASMARLVWMDKTGTQTVQKLHLLGREFDVSGAWEAHSFPTCLIGTRRQSGGFNLRRYTFGFIPAPAVRVGACGGAGTGSVRLFGGGSV